mgnify:FL=1
MEHRWLLTIRHRLLPPPSLNIGVIEGGTAGSTVPGECSFSTCVHYVPTLMNQDMVVKEFTEVVERISRSDAWMEHTRRRFPFTRPDMGLRWRRIIRW